MKVLIVVAHPDDEVLGVGGTILKHVDRGDHVDLLILGDGESSRSDGVDINKRATQAKEAAKSLGVGSLFLENLPDNQFDTVSLLKIVKIVEQYLNNVQPGIVYTHSISDLNIDHQLTFKAVLTACRPKPGHFVKKLFSFEVLSSTEWQCKSSQSNFCPTVYNDITDFIEKKVGILEVYKDEVNAFPHPRSKEGVMVLSKYRGMESGYNFAEAFQLIRELLDS